MTLTILEQGERLMTSCEAERPNKRVSSEAILNISGMNMLDYWRDRQLFMMSALSVIQYGNTVPPEQLVETRYLKQNNEPELYTLLSTEHSFDGEWYVYEYFNSDVFGKPEDDGEVFYNTLDDDTVDKFQICYEWSGENFDRDSLFLGNITEPSDTGTLVYIYNKNKTVTKSSIEYIFQIDRYVQYLKTVETFSPPSDNETEACSGQRLVVKKYAFEEDTETWNSQDYVLGYVEGKCGFGGYYVTGTATSHTWSIKSSGNTFSISNDTMTADLLADGLIPPTSIGQKIVVTITADGTFEVSGSMLLGYGQGFTLVPNRNILTFGMVNDTNGAIGMERSGSTSETMSAYFDYDYTVNGTRYVIFSITISGLAGNLQLNVVTLELTDSHGEIIIQI